MWLLVAVTPVVTCFCANTSSHSSDVIDDNIYQLYTHPVLLPSHDPWTLYLDRTHSALVAIKHNGAEPQSAEILDMSYKAKLFAVDLKSTSKPGSAQNYWTARQNCEPEVKPLYVLAAEPSQEDCDGQTSQLKLRVAELLGKHEQKRHAVVCFPVFYVVVRSIYSTGGCVSAACCCSFVAQL